MKIIIIIFVNLFILTVGGILLGLHLYDRRNKRMVARMLQVGDKPPEVSISLLREIKEKGAGHTFDLRARSEALLQQADVTWGADRFLRIIGVFAFVGFVAGLVVPLGIGTPLSALLYTVVAGYLPVFYVKKMRTRRLDALEKQLPDAMDFLARSMRAGHAFSISIGMVGDDLPEPLGREFRSLFNEQNLGAPLEVAFENFHKRVPLNDVNLFCSAAILQRRTGGNLSEILTRLSELVRDRFRLRGQVKAASAHGKMTAGILTAMPVLTMIGLLVVAPGYLQGLWNDDDGRRLVGAAVVAQIVGNFVIQKIVKIRV